MAEVRVGRRIAAPPERVWPYLADASRWPAWLPGVESSRVTNGKAEGVGRRQHLDVSFAGHRGEIELEITDWEPGRRIGWVHVSERIHGIDKQFAKNIRTSITLTPAGGGTEIAVEGSWDPVGLVGKMLGKTLVQSRASSMFEGAAAKLEELARSNA